MHVFIFVKTSCQMSREWKLNNQDLIARMHLFLCRITIKKKTVSRIKQEMTNSLKEIISITKQNRKHLSPVQMTVYKVSYFKLWVWKIFLLGHLSIGFTWYPELPIIFMSTDFALHFYHFMSKLTKASMILDL